MRIGIDFDNTIACYEGVFHAAALERGLISAEIGTDKNSVRDFLNGSGRKDDFTELQHHESERRVAHGYAEDVATPQLRNEARHLGRLLNHGLQPLNPMYRRGPLYSQHRSALVLLQGYLNHQLEDERQG